MKRLGVLVPGSVRRCRHEVCGGSLYSTFAFVARLVVLQTVLLTAGCGDSGEQQPAGTDSQSDVTDEASRNPAPSPGTAKRDSRVGLLRIYTDEPGFSVLIDNRPVFDQEGGQLLTPCAVTVPHGDRLIRVVRDGYRDSVQIVSVPGQQMVDLVVEADETADRFATVRSARFWDLSVGESAPLGTVNTSGIERDPWLSEDGLSLWFAGDRGNGRGVFVATRISPFHEFDEPVFISDSRNRAVPATPSLTADGLALVFAIPGEARIWSLRRANPLAEFSQKEALRFSTDEDVEWLSAQILSDGSRLYWVETRSGAMKTHAAVRSEGAGEFGKTLEFPLEGVHPCVSHDGLRQFSFDGQILRRSQRATVVSSFSKPAIVTSLDLEDYVSIPEYRQFSVSEDEQWMVYCPNPRRNADLFVVRLTDQPNWGVALRGKTIPDRERESVAAGTGAEPSESPETGVEESSKPIEPEVVVPDPRETALKSYSDARGWFEERLAKRDFEGAAQFLDEALQTPALSEQRQLLEWDVEDVERVRKAWTDCLESLKSLQIGDPVRLGTLKVEFMAFDGMTIKGSLNGQQIERKLNELVASNIVELIDQSVDRTDEAAQTRIGIFLFHDPTANRRFADSRLKRGGIEGAAFLDRQAERLMILATQDLEAGDLALALQHVEKVEDNFARTSPASRTEEFRNTLYRYVKWEKRGGRDWVIDEDSGEFEAAGGRQNGSFLVSPGKLGNFELRLEWRVVGPTAQGGVFFRYPGSGRPYDNALKIHLANDSGVAADMFSTGAVFKLEAPDRNMAKSSGEWNTMILRTNGDRVEVEVNGRKVQDTEIPVDGMPLSGHVALDGESGGITYRRVLLLPLKNFGEDNATPTE